MNGIADVAAAGGGAAVGGGSGTTVLNATGMASSVEQNNLVFLIPVILEVAEVAVTAVETGEAAERAGTAVLSAVRSLLSAGKSADTVSRLLTDMGLNGDVLVHEAKGGGKTSASAQTPTKGSAAPEPDGEEPREEEKMLGANGPQVTSKTLWKAGPQRIDVENPNPGKRPGQIHYQDQSNNAKYLHDYRTDTFIGAPKKVNDLLRNSVFKNAIQKGLEKYIGVSK